MFDALRTALLTWLRVPAEPHPPLGAPGSVRVFRAAKNYYRVRLAAWGLGQVATLGGIIASLWFLGLFKSEADELKFQRRQTQAAPVATAPTAPAAPPSASPAPASSPSAEKRAFRKHQTRDFLKHPANPIGRVIDRSPWWLFPAIAVFEFGGILLYLIQLPLTYAMVRLDFESHWYIVTDRSLRIRSGLVSLRESTMSFANLQQVTVSQGPLQRLFGLADVRVASAGGGGGGGGGPQAGHDSGDSMHTGVFHGVDNATEIRDLILARLKHFRAAGLGDPEEHTELVLTPPPAPAPTSDALLAAREVLAEIRALRQHAAT